VCACGFMRVGRAVLLCTYSIYMYAQVTPTDNDIPERSEGSLCTLRCTSSGRGLSTRPLRTRSDLLLCAFDPSILAAAISPLSLFEDQFCKNHRQNVKGRIALRAIGTCTSIHTTNALSPFLYLFLKHTHTHTHTHTHLCASLAIEGSVEACLSSWTLPGGGSAMIHCMHLQPAHDAPRTLEYGGYDMLMDKMVLFFIFPNRCSTRKTN